jgi:hypothetical protein
VLSILTGAAGAMWRFTHPSRQVRSSSPRLGRDQRLHWPGLPARWHHPGSARVRPPAARPRRPARPASRRPPPGTPGS